MFNREIENNFKPGDMIGDMHMHQPSPSTIFEGWDALNLFEISKEMFEAVIEAMVDRKLQLISNKMGYIVSSYDVDGIHVDKALVTYQYDSSYYFATLSCPR